MEKAILKRMELAKTGSFGADGATITLANLQDVVDTFDGKCPVSLGHYMTKQDWWPSWGNVETIELVKDPNGVDGILYGDVSLQPVLNEAIDGGFYTGWSVSIPARAADGKRYLHHLAMLGSVPPKIRDLKIIATTGKPDNAIDAKGEGIAFSDQAFYSFSDFEKEGEKELDDKDKGKEKEKEKKKVPEDQADFSDQLTKREERAKAVYKDGVKAKVISAIGDRWPAGKKDELCDFADKLVETHDYDFSDEGENKGKSLVDLFIGLVKGMNSAALPPTGRNKDFSDTGTNKPAEVVDRANMANKF
jgi:hypothetical protein